MKLLQLPSISQNDTYPHLMSAAYPLNEVTAKMLTLSNGERA